MCGICNVLLDERIIFDIFLNMKYIISVHDVQDGCSQEDFLYELQEGGEFYQNKNGRGIGIAIVEERPTHFVAVSSLDEVQSVADQIWNASE